MKDKLETPSKKEPPGGSTKTIPTSLRSSEFYKKFFPKTNARQWNNWKWQIRNRITTIEQLQDILPLTEGETSCLLIHKKNLPLSITPYYASLIDRNNPDDPIRKCVVPSINEMYRAPEEKEDPLGEDHQSPVECIVHRYPDRVLFLTTKFCSVNCRFCTRSRIVGEHVNFRSTENEWTNAFKYIESHKEIRDVLISGGDPLTMSDKKIEYLLSNLRKIEHVEMIRIGTKIPAVLPQRITPDLMNIIKKYHPVFMSLHFTHPIELTEETSWACNMLADSGVPLGSQTVLLSGVNDDSEVMRKLFTGLLKIRVRVYYMYQCDLITGSSHFRTPISKGLEIIQKLRGYTSGYAIPSYIIDSPNGGGKIPLLPNYVEGYEGDNLIMKNYKGERQSYPDVTKESISIE